MRSLGYIFLLSLTTGCFETLGADDVDDGASTADEASEDGPTREEDVEDDGEGELVAETWIVVDAALVSDTCGGGYGYGYGTEGDGYRQAARTDPERTEGGEADGYRTGEDDYDDGYEDDDDSPVGELVLLEKGSDVLYWHVGYDASSGEADDVLACDYEHPDFTCDAHEEVYDYGEAAVTFYEEVFGAFLEDGTAEIEVSAGAKCEGEGCAEMEWQDCEVLFRIWAEPL